MNTLKYYLWKDRESDSFDLFVTDNGSSLQIEGIILFFVSFFIFFIFKFNILAAIPIILAGLNIVGVFLSIGNSKQRLKKKSFKWQIQFEMAMMMLSLNNFVSLIKNKKMSDDEVDTWTKFYVGRVLENKSLNGIKETRKSIEDHFVKIGTIPMPNIKERIAEKFMEKGLEESLKKLYSQFYLDLDNGKFAAKQKVAKSITNSNKPLEKALRDLGLPPSMRDFDKIKTRYRQLVEMYHPDRNKNLSADDCHIKISEINNAFQEIKKQLKNIEI